MEKFDSRKYLLTAKLILLKAVNDIYPEWNIVLRNSLNNGVYITVDDRGNVSEGELQKIRKRMDELIKKKLPIKKIHFNSEQITKKHLENVREDLKELLETTGIISFFIYELDGYRTYFIEELYEDTSFVDMYEVYSYDEGFIFKTPKEIKGVIQIPRMIDDKKLAKVYKESSKWNDIMNVSCLGSLNRINLEGNIVELIRVNEALHNKKIAKIAEKIIEDKDIKIITIAGPSSSGKTTFSNRLKLQLLASELKPEMISLDDYYLPRYEIPLDENGKKDFESIAALDTELLNQNLKNLLLGEEVEIPRYDFNTGTRKEKGVPMKLSEDGVIIIEGIHGLNDSLLEGISLSHVSKIYISCLTQLNIDSHNRVKTSMVRKLRRIVRDSISRNFDAEETLEMWDRVRKGESKNIFPYQENADIIFDTSLAYEIGVLKPAVERELIKIKMDSPHYQEARKLLRILSYFTIISDRYVPDESILKEFIGGSYFYNY
ncbi:uridine kinase family protein [Cetobacterium sp.]|uniref:uridine kinase family protein n=1 Tax=Cetobacterium sp. TaxID=2071632 RepID=UPI002FC5A2D9